MKKKTSVLTFLLIHILLSCWAQNEKFTDSFMQDNCTFSSTGKNEYFILEPGYQLTLRGIKNRDTTKLVITVLNETRKINNTETRIVEENESVNNRTVEISRNYYAICKQTNTVFYFGEDVDVYKNGKIINHEGAWIAEGKNKAGIQMPGVFLLGSRYYQEIAPGIAMDRAEIVGLNEKLTTPSGVYTNCLKTKETNALKTGEKEYKIYANDIGLIKDGDLLLIKHGFLNK